MELEVRNKMDLSAQIRDVYAREILDFAGNPAIEVEVLAQDEIIGKASVSERDISANVEKSGSSEAGRNKNGKAVLHTGIDAEIEHINSRIAPALIGENAFAQHEIDKILKETGGSVFVVSLAVARAAAAAEQISLYRYLGGVRAVQPKIPILLDQEEWEQRRKGTEENEIESEKRKEMNIERTETLTEFFEKILEQQNLGVKIVLYAMEAGTEDSFLADLAVAANIPMLCVENRQSAFYTVLSNRLQQLEEKLRK